MTTTNSFTFDESQFDGSQIAIIRWGVEDGLDVSRYADPKFKYDQMREIRIELEQQN